MADLVKTRSNGKRGAVARTSWRRRFADRASQILVSAGGIAIIASILGILVFIAAEVVPLFLPSRVDARVSRSVASPAPLGEVVVDEYKTLWVSLCADGRVRTAPLDGSRPPAEVDVKGWTPAPVAMPLPHPTGGLLAGVTADGRFVGVPVRFDVSFVESKRDVKLVVGEAFVADLERGAPPAAAAVAFKADGSGGVAWAGKDGSLGFLRRRVEVNALTEEKTETWERAKADAPSPVVKLVLDHNLRHVYGGTPGGSIHCWDLTEAGPGAATTVNASGSPVTALAFLLGDRSLVVGQQDGSISVWFRVPGAGNVKTLTRIRDFPRRPGAVTLLTPGKRDKGFFAYDSTGALGLYYSTSGRVVWSGASPVRDATAMYYFPKGDGALLTGPSGMAALGIDNPHPDFSLDAILGNVWYEELPEPEFSWQTTGSDESEPQLSLTPLLVGTLKGTVYSLLLAIPVAILAAMYTSQFMHASLRRYVKPVVEIMAALPSVVLGFLAGLWLAPRLERVFPSLLLMLVFLPASVLLAGCASKLLTREFRARFPDGAGVFAFVLVLAGAGAAAIALSPALESFAFDGNFQAWLLDTTGLRYDQRNAVVVGIAMGFAVIPIIFAIAEDAFSNVPRGLVSASLALGANRWQTVTRVVFPTASPGVFSGIMVGFGRAVGETMIVLMAAGNTVIMTANPFDGFRTLSAGIATEIGEAAQGSTHYRTLFLAALLLFAVTFVVNTAAEVVRQRLRVRYSNL